MKKVRSLAPGVTLGEDGKLYNKEGKRVNYNGEELIEIDAEAYMKSIEFKLSSLVLLFAAGIVFIMYAQLLNSGIPPTDYEKIMCFSLIGLFGGLSILCFVLSKWKNSVYSTSKYVVNLPKAAVKNLEESDSIIGTINAVSKDIDADGDGTVLITEAYSLTEEEVVENVNNVDEAFSVDDFKDYVKSVFMIVQSAWSTNDYKKLRPYETDKLYVRHKLRIESMIKDNFVNKRTNVRVKGVLLKDYIIDDTLETMVVTLTANMKIDNPEGMNMNDNGDVPYVLKFVRKNGVKTKTDSHLSTNNCPNCGAVIEVDDNGVCKYCETSLVSGDSEWVLSDIRNIKISGM